MRNQIRTITCGCGECQTRKNSSDVCSKATSKEAIQLWCSGPDDTQETTEDILDMTFDIIESIMTIPEELSL